MTPYRAVEVEPGCFVRMFVPAYQFVWPNVLSLPRPLLGLAHYVSLTQLRLRGRRLVTPPFGWRYLKSENRAAVLMLPLWLYWPVRLWRDRYGYVFRPLMAMGLWRVSWGYRYWEDGRPSVPRWVQRIAWCFVNDAGQAPDFDMLEFEAELRQPDAVRAQLAAWSSRRRSGIIYNISEA